MYTHTHTQPVYLLTADYFLLSMTTESAVSYSHTEAPRMDCRSRRLVLQMLTAGKRDQQRSTSIASAKSTAKSSYMPFTLPATVSWLVTGTTIERMIAHFADCRYIA